jgi:hypothetical protein
MPKFLETKLKSEYGAKSKVPYKVMNSIGAMKGNKETAKGAAMQAKHEAKLTPNSAASIRAKVKRMSGSPGNAAGAAY